MAAYRVTVKETTIVSFEINAENEAEAAELAEAYATYNNHHGTTESVERHVDLVENTETGVVTYR